MVRVINASVMFALLTTAAVAQQAQPATDRVVPFSDPDRPGTLKVSLLEGSVTIKGSNRRDVLFVANSQGARDALRRRQQAEPPAGMRRLTQPGGFGVEERDNEMSVSSGFNRQIDLDIEVPMKTRLRVSVVNGGAITIDGVDSEIELNTVDGAIALTNVGGSVVAHAVDGPISATIARVAPQAPMAFTSLNGDIDVTLPAAVKANLRLRSDQGDVFTDFDVQMIASASANRTQRNGRSVRIDINRSIYGTVNGGGPDFELRTFDGNIYVRKGK
jgi:Putative adhesin